MKVFLPANFFWMATVSLSVLIGMGMAVEFCCALETIYHPNFYQQNKTIEGFFVEMNLSNKKKWLLSCSYNPTKRQISNNLAEHITPVHKKGAKSSKDNYTCKYIVKHF